MLYRALLLVLIAIIAVGTLVGAWYSPDGFTGGMAGFAVAVVVDLTIGLGFSLVLAIVRVAAGTEWRTHHPIG